MRTILFLFAVTAVGCTSPSSAINDSVDKREVKAQPAVQNNKGDAPKQDVPKASNITPAQLQSMIQELKRNVLEQLSQQAIDQEAKILDTITEADLAQINKWSKGSHKFHSSNSVLSLYQNARLKAGYTYMVKHDRIENALNNADYFVVVINGFKKYPGLQNRDDLLKAAEIFGTGFPLVPRPHVLFSVKDKTVYSDEDDENMLCRIISNMYKVEMTTEPYARFPE